MARKDEIFVSFLQHKILQEQYQITPEELPTTLTEGLNSKHVIIKALAYIVEYTDGSNSLTDKALFIQITQFLNLSTYDH